MIKRITQSDSPEYPHFEPPELQHDESRMLFHNRPSLRRLIVVADYDTTFLHASNPKTALLADLLTHPYIDLYRYADDGPRQTPQQVKGRLIKFPTYVGWAVTHPETNGVIPVTSSRGKGSYAESGISGNLHSLAREDTRDSSYEDLTKEKAAEQRHLDAVAVLAAQSLSADIYITDRPYLFTTRLPFKRNILVVNPEDALNVIGLYLRAQREYLLDVSDGATIRTSRWNFFWIASHELLQQSWRLYAATSQYMQGGSGSKPAMLESTLHHRLGQVLMSRDGVHIAINDINSDESLIGELDGVLVNLVSVMDVSAQIAHIAMGLTTAARNAKWQNDQWWRQFEDSYPDLSSLIRTGSYGKKILKLLCSLRNTIHDETLLAIKVFENPIHKHIGIVVVIPSGSEQEITQAADELGGHDSWGIKWQAGRYFVEPDILVDRLVPELIYLLDQLVEKIPLESLDSVSLKPTDINPPTDPQAHLFAEPYRKNIRMQLGL